MVTEGSGISTACEKARSRVDWRVGVIYGGDEVYWDFIRDGHRRVESEEAKRTATPVKTTYRRRRNSTEMIRVTRLPNKRE